MILISYLPHANTIGHVLKPDSPVDSYVSFCIKPGTTFLSKEDEKNWANFSKLKDVQDLIAKGKLKVVEDPKAAKGKDVKKKNEVPESLEGIEHKMKLELIASTFVAETLKMWRDEETDKDVMEALNEQIKTVVKIDADRAKAQLTE